MRENYAGVLDVLEVKGLIDAFRPFRIVLFSIIFPFTGKKPIEGQSLKVLFGAYQLSGWKTIAGSRKNYPGVTVTDSAFLL